MTLDDDIMEINVEPTETVEQSASKNKLSPAIAYANELKEDLKLNLGNLREKALTTSSMKAKWIGYLAKEKDAMARLSSIRSDYQKTLMSKSKGANAFDKLKTMNQDDDTLKKIDSTRKNIELSLEIISQAITALSEFGYNVKNSIDIIKLNGGLS